MLYSFRELVEEFIVLIGLPLCTPFMIISYVHSSLFSFIELLAVLDFIGLLCFSIIHTQGLLKKQKKIRSIIFLILVIVVIFVSGYLSWESYKPLPA